LLLGLSGCGKPTAADRYVPASDVVDFRTLFAQNCAGCHGDEGKLGPAPPLNDPLFLAIASKDQIKKVIRDGRPGTPMPPFAKSNGGALTEKQLEAIAVGLRSTWGSKETLDAHAPKYAVGAGGNVEAGKQVFASACASCHGESGLGGDKAGAVHDKSFLTLISDQALRRIVITGRPDLKMPDYRREPNGPALTEKQIEDVTALLRSWRTEQQLDQAQAAGRGRKQ
jgi:mono/diheme cytochrome c family protein